MVPAASRGYRPVNTTGMKGDTKMNTATLKLDTLTCPSCMLKIEAAARNVPGVDQDTVHVSFANSKVTFRFDENLTDAQTVAHAIEKVGYPVLSTRTAVQR